MNAELLNSVDTFFQYSGFSLTAHACKRMQQRSINSQALMTVLNYGRTVYSRNAVIYIIGRKEVKKFFKQGMDLSHVEGIQVLSSVSGAIITLYRNNSFKKLKSGRKFFKQ